MGDIDQKTEGMKRDFVVFWKANKDMLSKLPEMDRAFYIYLEGRSVSYKEINILIDAKFGKK
jgi:hypothetical protein